MKVYVLNVSGNPLMPCSPRKARLLLKSNQAKVICRMPFQIQLLHKSSNYTQKENTEVKVDIGSKMVGGAVVSGKQSLFQANLKLRTDISAGSDNKPKISGKMYRRQIGRRARRNHLRYRKSRWQNRGGKIGLCKVCNQNAKRGEAFCRIHLKDGHHKYQDITKEIFYYHLPPSIRSIVESHTKFIKYMHQLVPASKTIIEVAEFDIAKLKNPEISGEDYQDGALKDQNLLEYLKKKYEHKCAVCQTRFAKRWEKHHIRSRSRGESDAPDSFALVCYDCHKKIHRGEAVLNVKPRPSYKNETTMNVIKDQIVENSFRFGKVVKTYGYFTKYNRDQIGVIKKKNMHFVDAVYLYRPSLELKLDDSYYYIESIPRGNYQQFDMNPIGFADKSNKKTVFKNGQRKGIIEPNKTLNGFKKFDFVRFYDKKDGRFKTGFVTALFSSGDVGIATELSDRSNESRVVKKHSKINKLKSRCSTPIDLIKIKEPNGFYHKKEIVPEQEVKIKTERKILIFGSRKALAKRQLELF